MGNSGSKFTVFSEGKFAFSDECDEAIGTSSAVPRHLSSSTDIPQARFDGRSWSYLTSPSEVWELALPGGEKQTVMETQYSQSQVGQDPEKSAQGR